MIDELLELAIDNKDLRANLRQMENYELDQKVIYNLLGVVAYYENNKDMKRVVDNFIDKEVVISATEIMALTNNFYKYLYFTKDLEMNQISPKLRMQVFSSPPVAATEFEVYGLGVSILSGCPSCVKSHWKKLTAHLSKEKLVEVGKVVSIGKMLSQNIKNRKEG